MLQYHERNGDHLRNYIMDNLPEHLNGYDQGWLLINHIYTLGQRFSHIYSWDGERWVLLGTYVGYECKEDDSKCI